MLLIKQFFFSNFCKKKTKINGRGQKQIFTLCERLDWGFYQHFMKYVPNTTRKETLAIRVTEGKKTMLIDVLCIKKRK